MTNYQLSKRSLKDTADAAKSQFRNDKPMIRQIVNDSIDYLVSQYDLSIYQMELLCSYACKLHP